MKKRTLFSGLIALLLISIMAIAAAGCQPETTAQEREPAPDPFTVVWGPGKDRVITFSGVSAGHAAGEQSEFTLKLNNQSNEPWQGEYIVQLLDRDSIVMDIARDTFNIPSGLEPEISIPVVFDSGLDGPYGLSLFIPGRGAQSIHTIWIGEKSAVNAGPWPSSASHPWLWPDVLVVNEENSQQTAEDFVKNSPTFQFDGIEESLELAEKLYPDIENAWQFVYHFESRNAGYGDRTGQMLAQVVTHHEAIITVENGEITTAILDGEWDMLSQQMLASETSQEEARQTAEDFVRNSPTFQFDGTEESLVLTNTAAFSSKAIESNTPAASNETEGWEFTFEFDSQHAGYGDRTGEMLAQVITHQEAVIKVEENSVISAIIDGRWDMLSQEMVL